MYYIENNVIIAAHKLKNKLIEENRNITDNKLSYLDEDIKKIK
jgi:hypothetical protein